MRIQITSRQQHVLREELLREDRVQRMRQDFSRVPQEDFDRLVDADPTKGKIMLRWLLRMYQRRILEMDKLSEIKEMLTLFDKVKPKLTNRDIVAYNSPVELWQALQPFMAEPQSVKSKAEIEREIKKTGAVRIYENDQFLLLWLRTKEAAIHYGKGTKLCTSATIGKNDFDSYNAVGKIYMLINKYSGEKRQFYFPTLEFKDEQDQEVDMLAFLQLLDENGMSGFFSDELSKVNELTLGSCRIYDSLKLFTGLTQLSCNYTDNEEFPKVIYSLRYLKHLAYNSSKIKEVPDGISALINLEEIQFVYNYKLKKLPSDIGRLKYVKLVALYKTPLPEEELERVQAEMPRTRFI